MNRTPIASNTLSSAGYDDASRTLELEFASGRVYRYQAVPRAIYEWLLRTPRKGSYVARMINGHYAFHEVTAPAPDAPEDLTQALQASLAAIAARKRSP